MKFGYTLLYVADVVATARFYEKAFGLKTAFISESNLYAQMDTGATALGFVSEEFIASQTIDFKKNRTSESSAGFEVAFVTDDVASAYNTAIAAGALSVSEPTQKPWGQTVAYVRDNNGILVEICTPMG